MAAPIGPVGLLCLNKNAHPDRYRGLCAAAGMAVAYGGVAFCVLFGLKWVSGILETYRYGLEIVAGLLLIYMGWIGFRKEQDQAIEKWRGRKRDYLGDFTSSFAMTFFNPVPFATFTIVLTTFKILKGQLDLIVEIEFALLVMLGTMLFWLAANQLLHIVNKRSTSNWCSYISRGSAIALIVVGFAILGAGVNLCAKTLLKPEPATGETLPPDTQLIDIKD